ncbi:uncharacterized protein LOC135713465 [Ochlerotatus camptorhynchus]|uniref:uncharacterized protein LOC135713465 n=1 Tax=Ochlerotatus camptorhynchus TaxID=644619 RepID=UPI0031D528D8
MDRDLELKENLHRQIREYEVKGYAHKATKAEMEAADPRRTWYLPVGAVMNPKKPGKVRIIWDAAAKVDGVSLNSALLKGPDQLSSLPGVLFRFRQYGVAVSSDVQEMFHQLRIREEDKISQLFLWRTNPSDNPTVYVMDVATFGSTCSPASAQFVKNRNAEEHSEAYPEAAKAIIHDHYVDDYLASLAPWRKQQRWQAMCATFMATEDSSFITGGRTAARCSTDKKWQRWIQMIEYIAEIRIPRCYFPSATRRTYQNSEVHVFVDASEVVYSCAVYLRTFNQDGDPQGCLIAAKSKVAPLKPWSIPRLELQACVLGARWSKFVIENHNVSVSKTTYWTDSRTALAWIKADPRNYRQFVSYRVGEILEHSTAAQWRWVPSKSNPADEATKWGSGPYFDHDSSWFQGPNFLRLPEKEWPRIKEPVTATNEELRASILHHRSFEPAIDFNRFSSWDRLQRATAYALRFLHNTSKKRPEYSGPLQQSELRAAEETILKLVQHESYPDEVAALSNKAPNEAGQEVIGKQSSIYQLMPMLDGNGLLRERGRIEIAEHVPYGVRLGADSTPTGGILEALVDRVPAGDPSTNKMV